MKNKTFMRTKLATSLSLILGASGINSATAAEAASQVDGKEIEIIEVVGIRGSLVKSMDVKRSSSGIVDAINAEDMGKFPDSNLAESLQRISGVAIDRDNGEGSKVTVRGFGPERNLVLLNGRQLPTTTGDRSFNFANIASEIISGAEIHKTSDATIATGGIGATINILTHRPLNTPGLKASIGGKLMDDSSADDGDITPDVSGIYSNTFADDTFGISISGSYSKRESGNQQANVGTGWRSFPATKDQDWAGNDAAWGGVPKENQINRPTAANEIYSVPQTTIYKFEEQQRERVNGQLVLQYAPTDNFVATVDFSHMTNEVDLQFNDISAWYTFAPSENVWSDGPVSSPIYYSETYDNPQDISMAASESATKSELNSIGVNFDWQVNEDLSLHLDYHNSEAKETPNSRYGSSNTLSMAAFIRQSAATDFSGDLPILAVGGASTIQPSDMRVTGSVFGNNRNKSEIEQTQFSGKYELDELGSIDFGVSYMTADKHNQSVNVQRNDWGGVGNAGDFPDELFPSESIHGKFDDVSGGDFENHPDGADGFEIVNSIYFWDFSKVRDIAESLYTPDSFASGVMVGDCGTQFCPSTDYSADTDRYVEEKITAYYFQYNYAGEIGEMPFDIHVGVRYEETDVDSRSVVPVYDRAQWEGDTEIVLLGDGSRQALSKSGDYDHTLPNFNFNLEVTEDIILRAAYSETIGRASYGDLQGGTTVGTLFNKGGASGNSGNPSLEPLESDNYDLSAEWYYDDASYLAVGWFKKDVTNWITNGQVRETLFNINNPVDGPKYQEAVQAVGGDAANQRQWIYDNYSDTSEVYLKDGKIIIEGAEGDNEVEFLIDVPVNDSVENTFDGFEFAVQHVFGNSGFGTFVNYTMVDAGDDYNDLVLSGEFDNSDLIGSDNDGIQTGISDTANAVIFFEKYGISARLAYNWRDDYLETIGTDTGSNPVYVEDYHQFDFNVNYTFADIEGLSIFLEGINITDEYRRKHGRSKSEVINVTQQGSRYSLGARYTF